MQVMALSSQATCHSFLTVRRVLRVAARRSTALRLICTSRTQSRSRGMPGLRAGVGWVIGSACSMVSCTGPVRLLVVVMCFPFGNKLMDVVICYSCFYGYVCILTYGSGSCQACLAPGTRKGIPVPQTGCHYICKDFRA